MRRRTLLLLSLLLLMPALGILGLYLDEQREGRVSKANAERITVGMPLARVEELLGGRADSVERHVPPDFEARRVWYTGTGEHIGVDFHNDVVSREPTYIAPEWEGLLGWLQDRFGR